MSPPKETGALKHEPIPKLTPPVYPYAHLVQQACPHGGKHIVLLRGDIHFARENRALRGCFIRWMPRPATVHRRRLNGFKLAKLQMGPPPDGTRFHS
jgi:hypothetical protein